jgi:hypothetical protein
MVGMVIGDKAMSQYKSLAARLYRDWERAAKLAPRGGTPETEALWKAYCAVDDAIIAEERRIEAARG